MRRAAEEYGLREGGENDDWTLYWTDYAVSLERVMEMKSYQVAPSTHKLCTCWEEDAPFLSLSPRGSSSHSPVLSTAPAYFSAENQPFSWDE